MHGIVSLLDESHSKRVQEVWANLEHSLGLRGVYVTPFPHLSYHVAEHYEVGLLEPILRNVAVNTPPFEVITMGFGIFITGLHPLLPINIVRNPRLSELNAALWPMMSALSAGIVEYYHPDQWVPHITLSHGDITRDDLADAVRLLSQLDLTWRFPIDNLTLLYDDEETQQDRIQYQFPLGGKRPPTS